MDFGKFMQPAKYAITFGILIGLGFIVLKYVLLFLSGVISGLTGWDTTTLSLLLVWIWIIAESLFFLGFFFYVGRRSASRHGLSVLEAALVCAISFIAISVVTATVGFFADTIFGVMNLSTFENNLSEQAVEQLGADMGKRLVLAVVVAIFGTPIMAILGAVGAFTAKGTKKPQSSPRLFHNGKN